MEDVMERYKTEFKIQKLEDLLYRIFNYVLSFVIGFATSKAQLGDDISPFSLSVFAICPNIGLSSLTYYIGSFVGFITKSYSINNFKYILANSLLFIIISIFGPKYYGLKAYTPMLPAVICLLSGALFLFTDSFSIILMILLICESTLCGCTSFFLRFCVFAFKKNSKLTSKDLISINITLIIVICALNQYDVYTIPMSIIFVIFLNFLSCYLFDTKTAILFNLTFCAIPAILEPENGIYFVLLYLPTCVCSMISAYGNKHIFLSYSLPYFVIYISNFFSLPIPFVFAPIISGILFYILPKNKIEGFLSNYIILKTSLNKNINEDKSQLFNKFNDAADSLVKLLDNVSVKPIINPYTENKIKRFLHLNKCTDTKITNYYNKSGKQIISVICKSNGNLSFGNLNNKINSVFGCNFVLTENISDKNMINCKFEQADKYKVECYALCKPKKGETICGDNITAFKSIDNMYYMVLADGMGCGKEAFSKSNDAIILLKKILYSGTNFITAIESVNSSLEILKDDIGFSTLDICRISLNDGEGCFLKCGAYKSYVIRNDRINTINGGGFPAGLESKVSYVSREYYLKDNDIIVMMSDGVAFAEEQIQAKILMGKNNDIEIIAKRIIDTALASTPKDYDDDMTVFVAKIIKRNVE